MKATARRRMRVTTYGEPILRQKALEIPEITDEIRILAERMTVTMYENEPRGIGLAAPQVGVGKRLIVIDTRGSDEPPPPDASPGEILLEPQMPLALINPEILSSSEECEVMNEGCLSVPDVGGDVVRPARVVLKAQKLDGETFTVECGDLLARCLQHEIDHLNGVLFIDRVDEAELKEQAAELRALEKQAKKRLSRRR